MIVSLGSTQGLGIAPLVGAAVTAVVAGGVITGVGIGTTDIHRFWISWSSFHWSH